MSHTDQIVLVTGATGRQGGAVVSRLLTDGWKVRALTRNPDASLPEGVEVALGDLDDRASLNAATAGAWGVFSVHAGSYEGGPYGHDLEHEARSAGKLGAAARDAGVRHIVHSSSIGVGTVLEEKTDALRRKAAAEDELRRTGVSLTVLRPSAFMENTFDSPRELQDGTLTSALAAGTNEPLIAAGDIAAFAALSFAGPDRHRGAAYELAGDNLTQREKADLITRVTGREVPYVEFPIEKVREFSAGTAEMLTFLNDNPIRVDLAPLRAIHPGLQTFEEWMRGAGKELVDGYFARL